MGCGTHTDCHRAVTPVNLLIALLQVSGESRELRLALEKAQLDLEMLNIGHNKEIQKLMVR